MAAAAVAHVETLSTLELATAVEVSGPGLQAAWVGLLGVVVSADGVSGPSSALATVGDSARYCWVRVGSTVA